MVRRSLALASFTAFALLAGCSDYREDTRSNPPMGQSRQDMSGPGAGPGQGSSSMNAMNMFTATDPSIRRFFDTAYAYAIFPEIGKGGAGIGAAHGDGYVYEQGRLVGTVEMTQVTVGAQIGGQTYREVIFFQDAAALNRFKSGGTQFAANASAVVVKSGAAATNDYRDGVAVFVLPIGGFMGEAAIGGQGFKYRPMNQGW